MTFHLKARLYLLISIPLFFLVLFAFSSYQMQDKIMILVDYFRVERPKELAPLNEMEQSSKGVLRWLYAALAHEDDGGSDDLDNARADVKKFNDAQAIFSKMKMSNELSATFDKVNNNWKELAPFLQKAYAKGDEDDYEKFDVIVARAEAAVMRLQKNLNTVKTEHRKELDLLTQRQMDNVKMLNRILLFATFGGILLVIIFAWFQQRTITKLIAEVTNHLTEVSQRVKDASKNMSGMAAALSDSATTQANNLEETASSIEEISGTLSNTTGNAESSVSLSKDMSSISQQGEAAVNKLIDSMEEISKSNEQIQELVNIIGEVGEKTAIIDEIVFQTKLLSFNASVEAERAGEHGRGFAVVAQEVGNLAQMSGKAAQEISGIVKESLDKTQAITLDNKSKVEKGNALVTESAQIFKEIQKKSEEVNQSTSSILSASQEQLSSVSSINTAVSELDSLSQGNARNAEQTSEQGGILMKQVEQLDESLDQLKMITFGKTGTH